MFCWELKYSTNEYVGRTLGSTSQTNCLTQQIPATLDEIDRVCEEVRAWLEAMDLERAFFEVTLLLREALVNAVMHGAQGDESGLIDLVLSLEGEDLVIAVQDQGPGFDWQENMHRDVMSTEDHGRGLKIFKLYADDVQFNQQGNKVTLRKNLAWIRREI